MAATCLGCGLPLNDQDAFCGNCGRPRPAAPPAADPAVSPGFSTQTSGPPYSGETSGLPYPEESGGLPYPGETSGVPYPGGTASGVRYPGETSRVPPGHRDGPGRGRAARPPLPPAGGAYGAGFGAAKPPPPPGDVAYGAAQPPPPPPADAAAGSADSADEAARLSYADVTGEPTFDPLRNTRFGWQLARRGALFFLLGYAIDSVITLLCFLVTLASGSYAASLVTGSLPGPLIAGFVLSALVQVVLLVIYLTQPVPALMAQWSRLLGFHAGAADIAFEHITQAMRRHNTPCDSLRTRRLTPPGEGRRSYLELRRGVFAFYISCFAHGNDLYCGWTFWIYMSPLRWFMLKISRQIEDWTGRGNDMYQTLRYELTRAMIAAAHSSTQEGIEFAIRALDPGGELPGESAEVSIS